MIIIKTKQNIGLILTKSYFIGNLIFLLCVVRTIYFYFGSDAELISIIPDDAFYYIQLAKNRQSMLFWTFDGFSPTTGFHVLYGYFLYGVFFLDYSIGWRNLFLVVGLFSSACIGYSGFLVNKILQKIYINPLIALIGMAPFLTMPLLFISTSMMESWLVLLMASLTLFLIVNTSLVSWQKFTLLFILGLIGTMARTDWGMMPGAILLCSLIFRNFKITAYSKLSLATVLGSLFGIVGLSIHNYGISGELFQASAKIKYYWSSVEGHNILPYIDLICRAMFGWIYELEVSCIKKSLQIFLFVLIGVSIFFAARILCFSRGSNREVIFLSSAMTLVLYGLFYRNNSAALQLWYSANLIIPSSIFIAGFLSYSRPKALLAFPLFLFFTISAAPVGMLFMPYPHQIEMLNAGLYLRQLSPEVRYGAWNAGIISYFSNKPLINIDGLTNDRVAPYIKNNSLLDYLKIDKISFLIDYEDMLSNNKARKRGGYEDDRVDHCINPIEDASILQDTQWVGPKIKLFKVNFACI